MEKNTFESSESSNNFPFFQANDWSHKSVNGVASDIGE